jgi:outer membrane protein assembly factor BamB
MTSLVPSGDPDIDRIRGQVLSSPTDEDNFPIRVSHLTAWINLLQRQGVDLRDYIPILDRQEEGAARGDRAAMLAAIDDGFAFLERVQNDLTPTPSPAGSGEPVSAAPGAEAGRMGKDWPVYGGDIHHRGSTEEAGPEVGRIAWRFPIGIAWYARPVVEHGLVYAASPGMRVLLYCFDLATGELRWKTRRPWSAGNLGRLHLAPSSYTTPGIASTPVLTDDWVILNEFGAQGRNEAERCLIYVDRRTGDILRRVPAGYADYRMGYVALARDGEWLVYPNGTQRIAASPPQITGHNRLICARAADAAIAWDFHIGPVFAEPVLDGGQAFVGVRDGAFFCLNLTGASGRDQFGFSDLRRVAWTFQAGAAINAAAAVDGSRVIFGANDGRVHCLERGAGRPLWTATLDQEPRSFRLFSRPAVAGGRVYIASAAGRLYALDAATGRLAWTVELPDWGRACPVVVGDRVWVAAMDGALICLRDDGAAATELWRARVGEHPVYADLVCADGRLLVSASDLQLYCLDAVSGALVWRQRMLEHASIGGQEIRSDEMAGGGFYQSKPTAAEGKVFVGAPSRFVYAVDHATGRELWRFEMGGAVSGAPAYADGRLFIGQQGGEEDFYCLDAQTGRPLWRQALSWVWSSANVHRGRVFVPGVDGYLSCLDAATGHILWRYRTGRAAHPEPPVDGDRVFFGSWDHFVYAFDVVTGRLVWQFHTGGTPDSGAPIAWAGRLYLPMGGRRLCCLDAATGGVIWEYTIPKGCFNATPALWRDRLYISVSVRSGAIPIASVIRCLDAATGRVIWEHPGGGITGPAVAGGQVYTASTSDPFFRCIDARSGDEAWRCAMADRVYESTPAIYGGRAFILNDGGYLYAFD